MAIYGAMRPPYTVIERANYATRTRIQYGLQAVGFSLERRLVGMDRMQRGSQWKTRPRHVSVLILVALLHVMLLYALADGLAHRTVEKEKDRQFIQVRIIPAPKPMPQTVASAPPPKPKRARRPKQSPPPEAPSPSLAVRTPAPAPAGEDANADSVAPAPPIPAPLATMPPPAIPIRTAPTVVARSCDKPDYPTASRRLEESGVVVLSFLVDKQGHVVQSKIASSSGYDRLDQAALQSLSQCRFKPATVDGKPEQSWNKLTYVWQLDQ